MFEWVASLTDTLGYGGIIFLMFVENVFPPIPSEVVMPLAGYTAARGELELLGVTLAGMAGSILGALPLYYLGYFLGEERLAQWAGRHGHWLTLSGDEVHQAGRWFGKHGQLAVFLARLVPGVRSLISIPAGVARMNMFVFLAYSAVGTLIWSFVLALLGYSLGENFEQVGVYIAPISKVVFVLALAWFIGWFLKRKLDLDLPIRSEG